MTSLTYPGSTNVLAYTYDAMGHLTGMTDPITGATTASATYGTAGEIDSLAYGDLNGGFGQTFTYNSLWQLTGDGTTQYVYPAGQNNGRISQSFDGVQTVNYTYDRCTPYDVENRIITSCEPSGGTCNAAYGYDPQGKRVLRQTGLPAPTGNWALNWEFTFYGITGQRLATFNVITSWYQNSGYCNGARACTSGPAFGYVYFGGRLLWGSNGTPVLTDRLGSQRNGVSYYPWGEEKTTTPDGQVKFGTYFRDTPGQDYADQRYYTATAGRFYTPDPSTGVNLKNPITWNKYAYAGDDPVNFNDSRGTYPCWVGAGEGAEITDCEDESVFVPNNGACLGVATLQPGDPGSQGCFPDATPPLVIDFSSADTGGKPASARERLRDLIWMQQGWQKLKTFSTDSKDCLTDLGKFGLDPSGVATWANMTSLQNYAGLSASAQSRFNPNADFTTVQLTTSFIVYNQANFWQGSSADMLGTLLHEIIHLQTGPDVTDTQVQNRLGLTQNRSDSTNISKRLATDCFGSSSIR